MAEKYVRAQSSFKDLNLSECISRQCALMGLQHPTPVQYFCIPRILDGQDCIAASRTGTGKTLAFALPIIQKLSEEPYGIFALILTPTRELAFQIADQFRVIGQPISLKVCVVVGGMDMVIQGKELSDKPNVVISTPGRLADHLESCNEFSLERIKYLVLDEADRLLEGHFNEQLGVIFNALPQKRQTLLFSATITKTLEELKSISTTNPFVWSIDGDVPTVEKLNQQYVLIPPLVKDAYLVHIIHKFQEEHPQKSAIVFTRTCRLCQLLSLALSSLGFENMALHSMLPQKQRLAALSKFKSRTMKLLIATDVASRGLDIPTVDLVLNHNVPTVSKDYIHRVGRTARAGRGGLAVTLVTQYEIKLLHAIEELIHTQLLAHDISEQEVLKILVQVNVAVKEAGIRLGEMDFGEKKKINKRKKLLLQGKDPDAEERKLKKRRKALKQNKMKNKSNKNK